MTLRLIDMKIWALQLTWWVNYSYMVGHHREAHINKQTWFPDLLVSNDVCPRNKSKEVSPTRSFNFPFIISDCLVFINKRSSPWLKKTAADQKTPPNTEIIGPIASEPEVTSTDCWSTRPFHSGSKPSRRFLFCSQRCVVVY